jgi:protein-S-isoprenylcysteine O-methyltransferase Ste14
MTGTPGPDRSRRVAAALGSLVFFLIAPAGVAGLGPGAITGWHMQPPLLGLEALRWLGGGLVAAGAIAVVDCFARFALEGLGTPAPVAPTQSLVVSGLYRYVRNPMYLGVVAAIVGQALLFGIAWLVLYALVVRTFFNAFVVLYEEPTLQRQFGSSYDSYRVGVGRWWPRLKPWPGPDPDEQA